MSTKSEKTYVAFSSDSEITAAMIAEFVGKAVCVSWVKNRKQLRRCFEPQISVQGTLEGSGETGKFRVLLNDDTYSYFYDDSVWMIGYDGEKQVTDKQRPVIFIN
tara:strand:+ start:419 stop:733 length:315 start_codon:yes stop_codon:yes gene_type:complete